MQFMASNQALVQFTWLAANVVFCNSTLLRRVVLLVELLPLFFAFYEFLLFLRLNGTCKVEKSQKLIEKC
jgi:hypothetical protein